MISAVLRNAASGASLLALLCASSAVWAQEAPSNAELYKMIKALQAQQADLAQQAAAAKAEAAKAKAELVATKAELKRTKAQIAATSPHVEHPAPHPGSKTYTSYKDAVPVEAEPSWTVSGEWLYWNARQTELDFAIPADNPAAIGPVHTIDPEYDSGFRVGLEKTIGAMSFMASYTSFETDQFAAVADPDNLDGTLIIDDLTATGQPVDRATADWKLDYQAFDANLGHQLVHNGRLDVKLVGGVKVASIDEKFDVFYFNGNAVDRAFQTTEMDAYGANLGMAGRLTLGRRVALTGSVIYSPMIADIKQRFLYQGSGAGVGALATVADLRDSTDQFVSVIDAKVGVELLLFQAGLKQATLNVGYDFQHWINYPGLLKHTSESGETTFDHNDSSITFDGLRVGGAFKW